MGVEVVWDDEEKTIIRWILQGKLEWEEYEEASQLSHEMHSHIDHSVYTIFDAREMTQLPDNLLARFPQLSAATPSNQSLAVVIGTTGFVQTLVRIFSRVYKGISFVSSLEQAYATIEAHKQSQQ